MRILVTGDRLWVCHKLADAILRRLIDRYGSGIVIVHGGATGVDEAFSAACKGKGITAEPHHADWRRIGKHAGPIRNREMVASGVDLCIAVHRTLAASKGTKDCARQAIKAGIPTYLIDSEAATPGRLLADDPRLK